MEMTCILHGWYDGFYRNALNNIGLDRDWHMIGKCPAVWWESGI
jgi:hypothetical protein